MEDGVSGLRGQLPLVQSLVVGELKTEPDFATIQLRKMEEITAWAALIKYKIATQILVQVGK